MTDLSREVIAEAGAALKAKRGSRGMRLVAPEIGIGRSTICRIENGGMVDFQTFYKVLRWLKMREVRP